MADYSYKNVGDVKTIKFGQTDKVKPGGYCFLKIAFDVPQENNSVDLTCVAFERTGRGVWDVVSRLKEGVCVEVSGYLHSRKQTDAQYKNQQGQPKVEVYPQLVIQEISLVEEDEE